MGHTLTLAANAAVAFMLLDGVAFNVSVLLGTGIGLFLIPRAPTVSLAAACGALIGLVVYGVYDFTTYSTLRQWPFVLTLVDVAWRAPASAACAAVARIATR